MENRNIIKNDQNSQSKRTDQGDISKVPVNLNNQKIKNKDSFQADRGDTEKLLLKPNQRNYVYKSYINDDKTLKNAHKNTNSLKELKEKPVTEKSDNLSKNNIYSDVDNTIESQIKQVLKMKENSTDKKIVKSNGDQNKKGNVRVLDANERKRIRDRYTIKPKITSDANVKLDLTENDCFQKICHSQSLNKDKLDSKSVSIKTKDSQSIKKSEKSNRRPVITTIRSKHDTKVYKTVTFSELRKRETTPIQIKIPTDVKRSEKDKNEQQRKPHENITVLSDSRKEKSNRKCSRKKHRHISSPELFKKGESPPTEVAKWAPSCVNKHTIPYYEAWVDTTLAAISKCSETDNMILEKKNLLKKFKQFLERPETPELVYDRMDERYTGKIKVRQRHQ